MGSMPVSQMTQNLSYDCDSIAKSLESKIEEYVSIASLSIPNKSKEINFERLEAHLAEDCAWTGEAAIELSNLAQRYGTFMLMNALSLAIACDIEDGTLEF